MDKGLMKFYIVFFISFVVMINIFASFFHHTNNMFNYLWVKGVIFFDSSQKQEISIYENRGNVIIMMDDAWETQYTVGYKYMKEKCMRGSIAVIPSRVGEINYMNKAQLYRVYHDNWDLLNHTYNHDSLMEGDKGKPEKDILSAQKWLDKNGYSNNINILIYPYGEYNEKIISIMKENDIQAGRTTLEGFNSKNAYNLYEVKVKNVYSYIKPESVYKWVDQTINNRLTLILLFHKFEDVTDKSLMQYEVYNFHKIINYLDQKREDINIITYSEWVKVSNYVKENDYHA